MTIKAEAQARVALAHRLRDWGVEDSDAKAEDFISALVQVGWEPPTVVARASAPGIAGAVAHLRELRQEAAADLCSHGVKAANCLDHRRDTEPETNQPKEGDDA